MRSMGLSMLAACITYVHTMPHFSSNSICFCLVPNICSRFSDVTLKPNPTSLGQLLSSGVVPIPIRVTDADYVLVENCEADEKIYDVNGAVIAAKSATLSALTDSKLGVDSPYGFRAMFKSDDAKIAVQAILEGVTWYRGRRGLKPNPDVPSQPRLACVTEDTAELYASLDLGYDPWQRCLAGSPRKSPPPAFYAEGTVYTFLCPAFFVQTPEPYAAHCPTVHNNRFAGDPNSFYKKYQVYTLVYQLVRFYLGVDALDEHTDPPEQFDWNECVRLKTLDSVINPTNIQIYIACELPCP